MPAAKDQRKIGDMIKNKIYSKDFINWLNEGRSGMGPSRRNAMAMFSTRYPDTNERNKRKNQFVDDIEQIFGKKLTDVMDDLVQHPDHLAQYEAQINAARNYINNYDFEWEEKGNPINSGGAINRAQRQHWDGLLGDITERTAFDAKRENMLREREGKPPIRLWHDASEGKPTDVQIGESIVLQSPFAHNALEGNLFKHPTELVKKYQNEIAGARKRYEKGYPTDASIEEMDRIDKEKELNKVTEAQKAYDKALINHDRVSGKITPQEATQRLAALDAAKGTTPSPSPSATPVPEAISEQTVVTPEPPAPESVGHSITQLEDNLKAAQERERQATHPQPEQPKAASPTTAPSPEQQNSQPVPVDDEFNFQEVLRTKREVDEAARALAEAKYSVEHGSNQFKPRPVEEAPDVAKTVPPGLGNAGVLFEGAPYWLSQEFRNLAERAKAELAMGEASPFPEYHLPRIAAETPEEATAKEMLESLLAKGATKDVESQVKRLQEIKPEAMDSALNAALLEAQRKLTPENVEEYVNPQTNSMLDLMKRRMKESYEENIKPQIQNKFVGHSAWLNGKRLDAQSKAERDYQRNLAHEEGKFLFNAYNKASETASGDKQNLLNFYLNRADQEHKKVKDQLEIADHIKDLKNTVHNEKALDIDRLKAMGQEKRETRQRELDRDYQDFLEARNFEIEKTSKLNQILRGMPVGGLRAESAKPAPPQRDSSYVPSGMYGAQVGASILNTVLNNRMQGSRMQGRAHGGMIQDKAGGGILDSEGEMMGLDMLKQKYMANLLANSASQQPSPNPWMSYLSGLTRQLSMTQQRNPLAALAESATAGSENAMLQQQLFQEQQRAQLQNEQKGLKELIEMQAAEEEVNDRRSLREIQKQAAQAKLAKYSSVGNSDKLKIVKSGERLGYIAQNQTTGEPEFKVIPGQDEEVPLTRTELAQAGTEIKKLSAKGRSAREQMRELEGLEGAINKYNELTSKIKRSGTTLSKIANAVGYSNPIYNEAERTQKEIIDKSRNVLVYLKQIPGMGTDKLRTIEEGMFPGPQNTPAAAEYAISSVKQVLSEQMLEAKFMSAWSNKNKRNTIGAAEAFTEFWEDNRDKFVNKDGSLKPHASKKIDTEVDNILSSRKGQGQASNINFEIDEEENIPGLGDLPIQQMIDRRQALELEKRQLQGQ